MLVLLLLLLHVMSLELRYLVSLSLVSLKYRSFTAAAASNVSGAEAFGLSFPCFCNVSIL
jgi:hypothetical protein